MKWTEPNSALEVAEQSGDRLELGTRKKEESVMTPLLARPTGRQVQRREGQGRGRVGAEGRGELLPLREAPAALLGGSDFSLLCNHMAAGKGYNATAVSPSDLLPRLDCHSSWLTVCRSSL